MKKLMIAAAAVAMIGAAGADTLVYDFTAKVKTTKAKKSGVETTTYNLGKDSKGDFWYEEAEDAGEFEGLWTTKVVDGQTIPTLKVDKKNLLVWPGDYDADAIAEAKRDLAYFAEHYNKKSDGKYCCVAKIQESGCYRVETSETHKDVVMVEAETCCESDNWAAKDIDSDFTVCGLYLFGAYNPKKALKVSASFCGGNFADFYSFAAMGHGSAKTKLYKDADKDYWSGISSISGSIIGMLPAPDCASCCKKGSKAIAFWCIPEEEAEDADSDYPAFKYAYGTFSLKYSSSKTKKENKED